MLDDLRGGVIGDVLICVAAAGRADIVKRRERAAQPAWIKPVLELRILGRGRVDAEVCWVGEGYAGVKFVS